MHAEALFNRWTKAQESEKKVAAIHRLLPAAVPLTDPFIRTTPLTASQGADSLDVD
jgi:hypothetical protein